MEVGHSSMDTLEKMDISSPKSALHIKAKQKETPAVITPNVSHTQKYRTHTLLVRVMETLQRRK
jgi:hypothetical protein